MRMVEAERTNEHQGQSAGIIAARDRFYKGAIARDVVAFPQEHQAPLELSDFADFYAKIEPPAMTTTAGTRSTSFVRQPGAAARCRRSTFWST